MIESQHNSKSDFDALSATATELKQIIVIGSSAGGLEALRSFLSHLKDASNTVVIIIYHSTASSEKQLLFNLKAFTPIPILKAEQAQKLRSNQILIVPPQMQFGLKGNYIQLSAKTNLDPKNLPIDQGFKAIAETFKEKAVGIILSGAGSDGSKGQEAIAKHGGLCLCQTQVSAEHSSMPVNARKASSALALDPQQMPEYIHSQFANKSFAKTHALSINTKSIKSEAQSGHKAAQNYEAILSLLSQKHQIDFSYYQTSTITRRIDYRLEQLKLDAEAYYKRLSLDDKEVKYLLEHILIVVTEFFRDSKAFDSLRDEVIKPLSRSEEPLRLWVAGCATGEEAYSLAILFFEAFKTHKKHANFKIFATDLNEEALRTASQGKYKKEALAKLSEDMIQIYFEDEGERYKVSKQLRSSITFAKHNVYTDPPFTKIHLISCRNLLIFFKDAARARILSRFHFSLKPNSYLFLGPSEGLDLQQHSFEALNNKWRVFKKQASSETVNPEILLSLSERHKTKYTTPKPKPQNNDRLELLKQLTQEGFLLGSNFELLETFGTAHQLLSFPVGKAELNIFSLLSNPELQNMRNSLHKTVRSKEASSSFISVSSEDSKEKKHYQVITKYFETERSEKRYYFIQIIPIEALKQDQVITYTHDEIANERISELELALDKKDEELQRVAEALETTNEELMSSNEELMSSNEELMSVNEELNSVNEELHTVNIEYQDKLHAVTQANNDLINLQNVAQVGTVFVDKYLRIRSYSPLLIKKFNFMVQDIGRPVEHLIQSLNTDINFFRTALNDAVKQSKASEFEALDNQQTPYWVRLMPYINDAGDCDGAVLSLTEITQLKQAQTRLEEHNHFAENLIAATPGINYIYVFGKGRRTFAGNDFPSALGYEDNDESSNPEFLTSIMHSDDLKRLEEHNERLGISKKGEVVSFEFRVKHSQGHWVWMETRETVHKRSKDNEIQEVLGIALDISSHKRVEERLQHDALHDSLTGLRNRIAFIEHLNQTHKDFLRYPDQNYAVLFIDLDRFKLINDSYGHAAGDLVLKTTAKRIEQSIRNVDIVARHSGDEFLVLLKNLSSLNDAKKIANTIITELEKPILQEDLRFEISASIGIALANPEQNSPEFLINSADIAMYKSKAAADKKIHIFDDSLHLLSLKQVSMEHDLRHALRENQLTVHYQPIIDLQNQKIVSLEALARWPYKKGFISPDTFIPLAESSHLIGKIDKSIFDQACAFLQSLNMPDLKVNLNLAASQLGNPNTLEYLRTPPVNPKQLCLEITESQLLLSNPKAAQLLSELNDFGYNIAIDDFGTGYSSLAYLLSLPATTLKIDRSFVQSIESNNKSQSIITAIMNLAKSLKYNVVAEGIENNSQLKFIKSLGCSYVQGFLFSEPLSADNCKQYLAQNLAAHSSLSPVNA